MPVITVRLSPAAYRRVVEASRAAEAETPDTWALSQLLAAPEVTAEDARWLDPPDKSGCKIGGANSGAGLGRPGGWPPLAHVGGR